MYTSPARLNHQLKTNIGLIESPPPLEGFEVCEGHMRRPESLRHTTDVTDCRQKRYTGEAKVRSVGAFARGEEKTQPPLHLRTWHMLTHHLFDIAQNK